MSPAFKPGEQVFVDLSDKTPSPPGDFVVFDGMGPVVRHCAYVPHSKPAKVEFSARDKAFESYTVSLKKAQIIGRIIAKLQWL